MHQLNMKSQGIFIVLLILLIGFAYDIQPLISKIKKIRLNEINLPKNNSSILVQYHSEQLKSIRQDEVMTSFMRLTKENQLTLLDMRQMDALHYYIVMQGHFPGFLTLIESISQIKSPILLRDINLHVENGGKLSIHANLIIDSQLSSMVPKFFFNKDMTYDPFILLDISQSMVFNDSVPQENFYSIKHLKFAGFLAKNKLIMVFLKSSNGTILSVVPGMFIGIEHARVVSVSEKQVILNIQGKLFYIVKR